ncbi:MAG TPA: hypothetical protein VEF34_03930 [Syntrophobacteraceae bacterium]|nr:hypothetical protein [Syntrophobacteraceae bacterium]
MQTLLGRIFHLGVILISFATSLPITLAMWGLGVYPVGIFLRLIFVFIGDLVLRYSIMKSA